MQALALMLQLELAQDWQRSQYQAKKAEQAEQSSHRQLQKQVMLVQQVLQQALGLLAGLMEHLGLPAQ